MTGLAGLLVFGFNHRKGLTLMLVCLTIVEELLS